MNRDHEHRARWPRLLVALCAEVRGSNPGPGIRAQLWNLLRDNLFSLLCRESRGFRDARGHDLEDLASAKALELLLRAERGAWTPDGRSNGEVVNYLRATARHALARHAETSQRMTPLDVPVSGADGEPDRIREREPAMQAADPVEAREFTDALLDCLSMITARAQYAWFLRAVYEMPSRDIAAHPKVAASAANVDVILMRARAHLTDCLSRKEFAPGPLPPGAFTLLWNTLAQERKWAPDSSDVT